jgi:hypothetical protein
MIPSNNPFRKLGKFESYVAAFMAEDDKKPLIKWFDKFEKVLKKLGTDYKKSSINPTDALEFYYDKKSPEEAAEALAESVELDEAFDMKKMLNIFNKLKKNDTVKIKYDSSIGKGKEFQTFVVTSPKKTVGKAGVERVIMKHVDNPTGVKYTLYNRNGSVSLAIGDMAASMTDIKESVDLDEAIQRVVLGEAKAKLPMYDDALVLSPHASREVVIFNNTDPDGQSKENAWWVWQIKNALSDPAASTAQRGIYDITTTKDKKFLLKDGSDSDAQKLLKKFLSKGYTEIHPKNVAESVEQVDEYIKKDGERKRCAGGDGRRTDVDVDEAKQGELQQWKFPNERKAKQFLKDIENAGVAQGDLMQKNTKQVTIEILPGSPKVIDSAIAKYSKKNGGERFNQGSSGPFESVETISKDEQKLLDFINKNW